MVLTLNQILVAFLILLGIFLVGVLVPVLFELKATLKSARKQLESTGGRVDRTLDTAHETVARVSQLSTGLEGGEANVHDLVESLSDIAYTLQKVRSTVKIAAGASAAVVPAMTAFVSHMATRSSGDDDHEAREMVVRHEGQPPQVVVNTGTGEDPGRASA